MVDMDWFDMVQDRDRWWVLADSKINISDV
jgi:hypothetical protein